MNKKYIYNGKLILPDKIIENGCVLANEDEIIHAGTQYDVPIPDTDCVKIDASRGYISPGFVDIHVHGGGGHDFMDGTVEAYTGAAEKHTRHGTTSLVPTTLAGSPNEIKTALEIYKKAKELNENANFLGIHLEGPYFSMNEKGAQDPKYIRNPELSEYKEILQHSDDIIRWSAAPELNGAEEFCTYIKNKNILPSIAHSDAVFEQAEKAFEWGFTHVTHLYSGMSGVRRINAYRHAGIVEYAYYNDNMTVEIIADGVHLPKSLLKLIYKIKGADKTALVTDAMRAAGMPEGKSILGSLENGIEVIVEDGVAKLPDRQAFAGSVATADRLVRTMVKTAGVPLLDAVKMMTKTPSEIIHVYNKKGSLEKGKDADIIIFDEDINIKSVIIKGKIINFPD